MNGRDIATEPGNTAGRERGEASTGYMNGSKAKRTVRRAINSGAVAGFSGGIGLLWGIVTLGRGDSERGITRLLLGGSLIAIASGQRQSAGDSAGEQPDIDQTDVIGSTDIEAAASGGKTGDSQRASGDEAQEVVGSSVDIEDAGPGTELDSDPAESTVDQTDVAGSSIDDPNLNDSDSDDADTGG
ncbi:hypothetical protein [Halostella sp. PRR32]|uniref:hypothetical protein n=1 Tax=Halostella sp. PRR32 TaxID=3098147 RepID=UPI002B1D2725|nr:hypothetical protein [Halostella sp. PRR32]